MGGDSPFIFNIGVMNMLSRNRISSAQALEINKRKNDGESYAKIEQEMNISLSKIMTIARLYLVINDFEKCVYGCLLDATIEVDGRPSQVNSVYNSLKSYGYLKDEKTFLKLKEKPDKDLICFRRIGRKSIDIIRKAIEIFETHTDDVE